MVIMSKENLYVNNFKMIEFALFIIVAVASFFIGRYSVHNTWFTSNYGEIWGPEDNNWDNFYLDADQYKVFHDPISTKEHPRGITITSSKNKTNENENNKLL